VIDGPCQSPMIGPLEALGGDTRIIILDSRQGPAHARNLAVRNAVGSTIVFADSDVLVPTAVFVSLARVSEGKLIVPGILPLPQLSSLPFDFALNGFTTKPSRFFSDFALAPKVVGDKLLPVSACFSLKKKDFLRVNGFDESFKFPAGEDWDFFSRLQDAGVEVEFDSSIRAFHNNPQSHLGVAKRSYRYARHGALASPLPSTKVPETSREKTVKTTAFVHLPAILLTGILKIMCVGLSVGDDKLGATARRLHNYQVSTQTRFKSQMAVKLWEPAWLSWLNQKTSSLLDSVIAFPVTTQWEAVIPVRDDISLKDKRGYRLLVVIWTVAYILGYIVRERAAKQLQRVRTR